MNQSKTALTFVFQQLGDLPMPKDEWYVQVFRNFDRNDSGLLDIASFKDPFLLCLPSTSQCLIRCSEEIVVQWDEHHLQKARKVNSASRASGGLMRHCNVAWA
eukprot:6470898-Amphidinium_carterae.1